MVEQKQVPQELLRKITAWPRGTTAAAMRDGYAKPLGEYHPVAWADEDLQIVRLEWRDAGSSRKA